MFLILNKGYVEHTSVHGKHSEEIDAIVVDVFIRPDIIYSGYLIDFNYSPAKDELENLILFGTKRRKIHNETAGKDAPKVSKPVVVPGDILY